MKIARLLICSLLSIGAFAQTFRGNLAGVVTDSSEASVSNAMVSLESPLNGLRRATVSSESGSFLFAELPVGIYTLTVNLKGFEITRIENVEVSVSKTTSLPVRLSLARQQEIVHVSASQVELETKSSDLAVVVDTRTVNDLPINGRDFRELFKMAPGVQAANNPGNMSVNGTRTNFINYQIDGVDNNDASGNNIGLNQGGVGNAIPAVYVPIESIDQLSVQSNAAPDMSRNGGANVNTVVRSGTNLLHGSLYEYNRNEALASRSPLLSPGTPKQVIRNNQFGFSAGGPVIRNNTFFFLNGEAQRATAALSVLDTSPSAAWVTQATGLLQQHSVPVNPVSMNLLNFYPAVSRAGPATTNNYLSQAQNQFKSYNAVMKVDHRFTDNHTIFVRYVGGYGWQTAPSGSNFQDFFQTVPAHIHNFGVVENDVWSPRLVNQITVGVNYFRMAFDDFNTGFYPLSAGLNTGVTDPRLSAGSPRITISGFDSIGASNGGPLLRTDPTGHLTDSLSYMKGRHQFKFGGEVRRSIYDSAYFTNGRGTFAFDGSRGPWASDKTLAGPLKALADFLAGYPSNSNGASIVVGDQAWTYAYNSIDWWAHDTFEVNPQLSLNFGVRYTYQGEVHGVGASKQLYNFTPAKGFTTGPIYHNDLLNFAPRVGFSYAPGWLSKTVLRGGYGIYYDTPTEGTFGFTTISNGGASGMNQNPAGPSRIFAASVTNVVFQPGVPIFGGATPAPPYGVLAANPNFAMPRVHSINFDIQHEFTRSTLLQMGYVGSFGRDLPIFLDINQPVNGVRPLLAQYPTLGAINQWNTIAFSNYNSLQTLLRQRLWKGLTANFNYTWSHAIDDASDTKPNPENSYNLINDIGSSKFDARQIVSGFMSYEAPQSVNFAPRLTRGWQFNALFTASTGSPFNILAGTNVSGTGENQDRVNLVGDPFANVAVLKGTTAVQYFNPAAFAKPAAGTYGNMGRDALYGPGFGSVDFSVFKRTPITERIGTELRVEIFNIFNRTNWANPNTTFTSGSFGQLTATKNGTTGAGLGFGEPRNTQLSLRITF
jgi:hypothetical protein